MNPDRHAAAKELFLALQEVAPADRIRRLDELAGDDRELRQEVASLLAFAGTDEVETAVGGGAAPRARPEASRNAPAAQPPARPALLRREALETGMLFAGRYRIVAELGRGGMGQVYRAHDLVLDEPVALKLVAERRGLAQRMVEEVRLARRVTHPNVCRVYDFGEADGVTFLTMEYVDGEDLRSLLSRIGRLPQEKLLDLAQQICAGLAAAHGEGILHRDLKPGNVMIDGRGRARITDFGLATPLGPEASSELLGTPAYLAPEQWSAGQVSIASDLYALGLVLHEMATGDPVFRGGNVGELMRQHIEEPATVSSRLGPLDPQVEAVILQCLEKDPRARPSSAAAVAAALPGGDRLALAMAAGETPPPELVAAAERPAARRRAIALPAALLALALVAVLALSDAAFPGRTAWRNAPPEVLAARAGEHLAALGHDLPVADRAWGFRADPAADGPGRAVFWYRQSPETMLPTDLSIQDAAIRVAYYDPPPLLAGMVQMLLDPDGRLLTLKVVPADFSGDTLAEGPGGDAQGPIERGEPAAGEPATRDPERAENEPAGAAAGDRAKDGSADTGAGEGAPPSRRAPWDRLLAAAGLAADAPAAAPGIVPPFFADARRAWEVPGREGFAGFRLEAAALGSRVVWADLRSAPADLAEEAPVERFAALFGWAFSADALLWTLAVAAALLLARNNLRSGRGDLVGARRVAVFVVGAQLLRWLVGSNHFPEPADERLVLAIGAGRAVAEGALTWLAYVALEPLVRRFWPHSLVGWGRLVRGRPRDPEVGRSLLVGATAGAGLALLTVLDRLLVRAAGLLAVPEDLVPFQLESGLGARRWLASTLETAVDAVWWALLGLFLLALLRRLLARPRLAVALWLLLQAVYGLTTGAHPAVSWATVGLAYAALGAWLLVRAGLLAYAAALAVEGLLLYAPITRDLGCWYGEAGLFSLAAAAAIGALGGWIALRPRAHAPVPAGPAVAASGS